VFVPTRVPPHKEAVDDPGPEVRLAMCEAAVGRDERFGVSRIELDRPGPSYTVDTLRSIHATSPGDELTFIVGGDMAASLPQWREPEALLDLAVLGGLRGAAERVRFFSMPRLDVSSTDIRDRVRAGRPIRYLVPDDVARLIGAQGLYRTEVHIP